MHSKKSKRKKKVHPPSKGTERERERPTVWMTESTHEMGVGPIGRKALAMRCIRTF